MKIEDVIDKTRGHVMCRVIKEASFDEWVAYLFDRPECDYGTHWSFEEGSLEWGVVGETTAGFIARTYEDSARWLSRFSNAQIAAGLGFTWNPAYGDVYASICHEPTPLALRLRAIRALVPLYKECFQKRCAPALSNLNEAPENPLNCVCYMYWDVCPFFGQPEKPELGPIDEECLNVMETTLQIDHDACRESALHGLGHWALAYPSRAASIIEQGLKAKKKSLRRELLDYAQKAKTGNVQ